MKNKNRTYKGSEPVELILCEALGEQTGKKGAAILARHRIHTIGQLSGAIRPFIPLSSLQELRKKHMTCSIGALKKAKSPDTALKKLQKNLKIKPAEAQKVFDLINSTVKTHQVYRRNFNCSFGMLKPKPKNRWVSTNTNWRKTRVKAGMMVIPSYDDMGPVFDQSNRGTCVANAAISLIDYKSASRFSRQFNYHQCKMIDGSPNEEGTYIETPFETLVSDFFLDYGCVEESVWPYNPHKKDTKHQGPPPEAAFDGLRVVADDVVFVERTGNVEKIKKLLNHKEGGKTCPVVIGVPLFESFFSDETYRTGWTTMPLDGEIIVGYHAMIIVGYDEDRGVFLVRNSWSASWAAENDRGYSGHAWMPYEYISNYCFTGATVAHVHTEHVTVAPEDRLYNNLNQKRSTSKKKAAAMSNRKNKDSTKALSASRQGGKKKNNEVNKEKQKPSFASLFLKAAVIVLLIKVFYEPLKSFAFKALNYINESNVFNDLLSKFTAMFG